MFLPFVLSYIFLAAVIFVFINILATSVVDQAPVSDFAAPLSLFLVSSDSFCDVFSSVVVFFDTPVFERFLSFFGFDNSPLVNCYTHYYQQRPRQQNSYWFLKWLGKIIVERG